VIGRGRPTVGANRLGSPLDGPNVIRPKNRNVFASRLPSTFLHRQPQLFSCHGGWQPQGCNRRPRIPRRPDGLHPDPASHRGPIPGGRALWREGKKGPGRPFAKGRLVWSPRTTRRSTSPTPKGPIGPLVTPPLVPARTHEVVGCNINLGGPWLWDGRRSVHVPFCYLPDL